MVQEIDNEPREPEPGNRPSPYSLGRLIIQLDYSVSKTRPKKINNCTIDSCSGCADVSTHYAQDCAVSEPHSGFEARCGTRTKTRANAGPPQGVAPWPEHLRRLRTPYCVSAGVQTSICFPAHFFWGFQDVFLLETTVWGTG